MSHYSYVLGCVIDLKCIYSEVQSDRPDLLSTVVHKYGNVFSGRGLSLRHPRFCVLTGMIHE